LRPAAHFAKGALAPGIADNAVFAGVRARQQRGLHTHRDCGEHAGQRLDGTQCTQIRRVLRQRGCEADNVDNDEWLQGNSKFNIRNSKLETANCANVVHLQVLCRSIFRLEF
jgi:hypothetical protein